MSSFVRGLVFIALALAPSLADAECAWVLWTTAGPQPLTAFPKVENCHTALAAVVEGMKQTHGTETWVSQPKGWGSYDDPTLGKVVLSCLPDTIDPRGSKGSNR